MVTESYNVELELDNIDIIHYGVIGALRQCLIRVNETYTNYLIIRNMQYNTKNIHKPTKW